MVIKDQLPKDTIDAIREEYLSYFNDLIMLNHEIEMRSLKNTISQENYIKELTEIYKETMFRIK